jgi:hypothetical protein
LKKVVRTPIPEVTAMRMMQKELISLMKTRTRGDVGTHQHDGSTFEEASNDNRDLSP